MASVSSKKLNPDVHVGTRTKLSTKISTSVHFHNFTSLQSKKGDLTTSPEFECHGEKWRLELYPGGCSQSKKGRVALFLHCLNNEPVPVTAKYSLCIPKTNYHLFNEYINDFNIGKESSWGQKDYKNREDIISSCLDANGTLTIRVDIQVISDKIQGWKPKETLKNDLLQILKSGEDTDVTFSVGGRIMKAHCLILKIRAPLLHEIVVDSLQAGTVIIPIPDVEADTFRSMIEFLYTDECPKNTSKNNAKELLTVANKFGCQRLKLLIETELVEKYLNANTSIDLLLFADCNSCALLKESAMKLIVKDLSTAKMSSDWTKIKESSDLLDEVINNLAGIKPADSNNLHAYSNLSVREILCKLEEKNLDIDGTRQMLLKRLQDDDDGKKESSSCKRK